MEQVNTFGVYLLGKWLDSIFIGAHSNAPVGSNILAWRNAQSVLFLLLDGGASFKLGLSRPVARQLLEHIGAVIAAFEADEHPSSSCRKSLIALKRLRRNSPRSVRSWIVIHQRIDLQRRETFWRLFAQSLRRRSRKSRSAP